MKFQSEVEDQTKERMPMDPCGSYALTLHDGGKQRPLGSPPSPTLPGAAWSVPWRARSDAFTPGLRCRQGEACYKCLQANIGCASATRARTFCQERVFERRRDETNWSRGSALITPNARRTRNFIH